MTCGFITLGRTSKQFLEKCPGRSSSVSQHWLPVLNLPDFFLYKDPATNMEDLTAKFSAVVAATDADILRRVQASTPRREVACRRMHG